MTERLRDLTTKKSCVCVCVCVCVRERERGRETDTHREGWGREEEKGGWAKEKEIPVGFSSCEFFKKFIYLFMAALGLSCSMQDLSLRHAGSWLQCTGFSLVAVHGLSSCGALAL